MSCAGLLGPLRASRAGEEADPRRVAEVLAAAHLRGDQETFRRLTASLAEGAWVVADELLGLGLRSVAADLARAATVTTADRLTAYVRRHAATADDPTVRAALRAALDAVHAEDLEGLRRATAPPGGPSVSRARLLILLADAHFAAAGAEARGLYLEAATVAEEVGWWEGAVDALAGAAEEASAAGDWIAARDAWRRVTERESPWAAPDARAVTRANLGRALGRIGAHGEAVAALREGLALLGPEGDAARRGFLLWNLGTSLTRRGEWRTGLGALDDARRAYLEADDDVGVGNVLVELAKVHRVLGDDDRALRLSETAMARLRTGGGPADVGPAAATLASVLAEGGWLDEAARLLDEAERHFADLGDDRSRARVETSRSDLALRRDRPVDALASADRALAAQVPGGDREGEVWSRANRAAALRALEIPEAAWQEIVGALRLARDLQRPDLVLEMAGVAAEHALHIKRPRKALSLAQAGVRRFVDLFNGLAEVESAIARSHRSSIVTTGLRAARGLGDLGSVLWMIEAGRSQSLLDALGGTAAMRDVGVRPDLLEEETRRRAEIAGLRARVATSRAAGVAVAPDLKRGLREALEEYRVLAERIRREGRTAAGIARPATTAPEKLVATVKKEGVRVAYVLETGCCGALVLDGDGLRWVDLPEAEIQAAVEALRPGDAAEDFRRALERLRLVLVAPLALPPEARRVLVSPDGALFRVPFPAILPDRVVVEVPSLAVLAALPERAPGVARGVLALGDPDYPEASGTLRLPASAAEVRAVAVAAEDRVLLGSEATERALLGALSRAEPWAAVHLACHGVVDPKFAVESALLLTPEREDDGRWTVQEILRTRADADLVVLSACDSAGGPVLPGEGVLGLTSAFLCAGASRVVASLWPVGDEATAELMSEFHRQRRSGAPAADALHHAQRHVAGTRPHPRHWAGWVLWGRPD